MSQIFDEVVIIYNPNSTGDGKKNAYQLKDDLESSNYPTSITMRETESAGHAEDIAKEYAPAKKSTLLISSSGDGGYHEMVNGVIESGTSSITTGLLPSGNANDHYHALIDSHEALVSNIVAGKTRTIDALKITSTINSKPWIRYAHSYVGIGLTPTVGQQLTKTDLNLFNEKWLVLKYLFKYTHATILIDGKRRRFTSLVFSNIAQMSKVLKLAKESSVTDGKFEISSIPYRSKLYAIVLLIKSATFGLEELGSFSEYSFRSIKRLLIQLDGEVYRIDKESDVKVETAVGVLKTIL